MKNLIIAALIILGTLGSYAQKPEIYATKTYAINGYDAVAYFKENMPVKGNIKLIYRYKEANWLFSSEENLREFKENPEKFIPQYGGYCAYGTSQGYKANTEPDAFTILNGKLYLNYNKKVQEVWNKNRNNYIIEADANWLKIKDE